MAERAFVITTAGLSLGLFLCVSWATYVDRRYAHESFYDRAGGGLMLAAFTTAVVLPFTLAAAGLAAATCGLVHARRTRGDRNATRTA